MLLVIVVNNLAVKCQAVNNWKLLQGVLKMVDNIYITSFYVEIQAENSTNLL
jgi:hypothetical protein